MKIAIVPLQGKAEEYGRDLEIVGCYFYSRERIEFDLIATAGFREWCGRGRICLAFQTSLAPEFVTWVGGGGETDRQTDRQTGRQTGKQTDQEQTQRHRNRERDRDRETETERQREREGERDRQRQRDRERQREGGRDRQRQRDRERQRELELENFIFQGL